jgi:hypothetical protein
VPLILTHHFPFLPQDHRQGDRMESFFLSETLKYMYLLFDADHAVHRGAFVFSTEAHYFPIRADWLTSGSQSIQHFILIRMLISISFFCPSLILTPSQS